MRWSRRAPANRDQDASPFSSILRRLCEASAARAAALVDADGETVDYAGGVNPFDLRVAAAELRLVLGTARAVPIWTDVSEISVRGRRRSYVVVDLSEGYALVLELDRHGFGLSRRALSQAVHELRDEARLPLRLGASGAPRWSRVEVRVAGRDSRRPEALRLDGVWRPVTVLGRYQDKDLARREVGYLARLPGGTEFSLIREPLGHWFVDDDRRLRENAEEAAFANKV